LELDLQGPRANVCLKVAAISEAMATNVPPILLDLLELAAYVYAADQAAGRGGHSDSGEHWRRNFRFHVPVRQPEVWSGDGVSSALVDVLSFLSDDDYEFCFSQLEHEPSVQLYFDQFGKDFEVDEVMLFSGGLDSLSGAIHETIGQKRRVALVSHDSASKRKPLVDDLAAELTSRAPRGSIRRIPVWATKSQHVGREYTQRSRSFLYAALATAVARMLGKDRIRFYENGVTSINLPIAPQVVGGRATRTTHPQVIKGLAKLYSNLFGIQFAVESPFLWKTKTDVVKVIRDHGCGDLIRKSVSCSRTVEATKLHTHCGRCSQCIDRRVATLAAGATDDEDPAEMYKVDLLVGERAIGETRAMAEGFLQRARDLQNITEEDFLAQFTEVSRALRHVGVSPDEALTRIVEMHRRHSADLHSALSAGIGRHAADLQDGRLPDTCLLVLSLNQRYRQLLPAGEAHVPTFKRDGDFWRVRFENEQAAFKDSVGLRHISRLLCAPKREFHCSELLALEAGLPDCPKLGSAGDAADKKAIREYKAHLKDIKEGIAEAEAANDIGKVEHLREREGKLEEHLRSAVGLGGRARKAADDAERVRKSVSVAISRSITAIRRHHPELARHLRKCLKTGASCSYSPEPPVAWITA
jgi:hypothetical protein